MSTFVAIAQAQLDAYNRQDLDAFCAHFSDDVKVADLNGALSLEGGPAYRARYEKVFADFPENKVTLLGRMAIGNVVIDHERVARSLSAEPFDVIAIYTFKDNTIARVDFVKA